MKIDHILAMLVACFATLIATLFLVNTQTVFDPPYLLPILNILFLSVIPFFVTYTAARLFLSFGSLPVLMFGKGMLALGLGGAVSGWFIGSPAGPNMTITIYNCGALLCAVLNFCSALTLIICPQRPPLKRPHIVLALCLLGLAIIFGSVIQAAVAGISPPFIAQGIGPTLIGRAVLVSAIILFMASAALIYFNREVSGIEMFRCYAAGLVLMGIGLTGVLLQRYVGSPLGWAGRCAQYAGAVCILMGVVGLWRLTFSTGRSLSETVEAIASVRIAKLEQLNSQIKAGLSTGIGSVVTGRDITERKQAEEKLCQNEERLKLALDAAHLATWDWSIPSGETVWNSEHYLMLGYEPDSFAPTYEHWASRVHPDDLSATEAEIARSMIHGDEYRAQFRVLLPDGSVRCLESLGRFERDQAGQAVRLYGVMSDVTNWNLMVSELRQVNETLDQRVTERTLELQQLNAYNRSLIEASLDPLVTIDLDGKISDVNSATEKVTGCLRQELIGTDFADYFTAPDIAREGFKHVLKEGYVRDYPLDIRHNDGAITPVLYNATVYHDNLGNVAGVFAAARDITALKQAEADLQSSNRLINTIIDSVPARIFWKDTELRLLGCNKAFARDAGVENPDDLTGKNDQEIVGIEQAKLFAIDDRRVIDTGNAITSFDEQLITADGEQLWICTSKVPLRDEKDTMIGVLGCYVDVTARKQTEMELQQLNLALKHEIRERTNAEAGLKQSQELFSLLMKHTPVYTFIKEIEGEQSRVVLISDNFIDMIGRPADELRGRTMEELFPADFARKITDDDLAVVKEGVAIQLDEELNGRSYTTIKFPITRNGDKKFLAGFTIDVTERRKSEAQMRESDERFRLAFENANIGMCLVDLHGKFFKVNRQMCEIFGYSKEELEGMNVNSITHPAYLNVSQDFIKRAESGQVDNSEFEKEYIHKDGRLVVGQVSSTLLRNAAGEPLYFISHVLDITHRKKEEEKRLNLERQLLHAQKLESLGVLAGGIAHDFNNILMAILGNAEIARMKVIPESPIVTNLQQIEQAAMRAADLAKQMLAYSGKGRFIVAKLDLNHLVKEMLSMLEVSISRKALLKLNLAPELPAVEADSIQIQQIIMNLVINASEAIGDDNGFITIRTGCMECTASYLKQLILNDNTVEGLYVYLEITDTGCGMDRETLNRIFDPFFTTKFTGRGLGMAAVHGIVRGHKGGINIYSEPGKGTTFKVLLPAMDSPVEILSNSVDTDNWQGRGTVLLVDDEEMIRGVGSELFKALGFAVLTAADGVEALGVFKSGNDIDLVILDLTMPNMDGEECFRELRQINPGVKVIMTSGYSEQEVARKFDGKGVNGFIQKPFRFSAIKDVLRGIGMPGDLSTG